MAQEDAGTVKQPGSADLSRAIGEDSYDRTWAILQNEPRLAAIPLEGNALPLAVAKSEGAKSAEKAIKEHIGVSELCSRHAGVATLDALRFLRARQLNVDKASKMLASDLVWRTEFKPAQITQADIPVTLPTGCWRLLGTTTSNHPVLWIQVSRWHPNRFGLDEYVRLVVFFCERMRRIGTGRFVVFFDMRGWKLSFALQLRKVAALISTLQDHYPECLEAARLMAAPSIFAAAWKLIQPMMDPITAAKVAFVMGDKEAQAFEALAVPSSVVPNMYGGVCDDNSIPVPNIPGEQNVTVIDN
jgi:hypothetical protein